MQSATENNKITQKEKFGTHEIPTRKQLGATKYPRKKIWEPRNTHKKKFVTHEIPTKTRWQDATKPTRPTITRCRRNLVHSFNFLRYLHFCLDFFDHVGNGINKKANVKFKIYYVIGWTKNN